VGVDGALQGQRFPVRDTPEPAGPQRGVRHASSASQSRVSMIVRIVWRNFEA
jgi:hypothetical protein